MYLKNTYRKRLIMSPHISVQTTWIGINTGQTMYGENNRNIIK